MTIKKSYVELVEFLEQNKDQPVHKIINQVKEMASSQVEQRFKKDNSGNVTHVYCYYHKEWEKVSDVEYGPKASNKATGLNTMCKDGVRNWTKQNNAYKKTERLILNQLLEGEITQEKGQELKAIAIKERDKIIARK